ncbi:MAG: membrane protein insertase YidC [Gemmatimonadetes bacterium]|nr:membrane protein insertase YidC [Gemmatimonadota bacterium]
MDQRRVLLAFVLMALVLVASQWWYSRLSPPPEPPAPADTTRVVEPDTAARPLAGRPDTAAVPADTVERPAVPADTAVALADTAVAPGNRLLGGAEAPDAVVIETPLYRARLLPLGALLEQVELLRYPSFTSDTSAVLLVPADAVFLRRAADLGDTRLRLDDLTYAPSDTLLSLVEGDSGRTLEFAWEGGGRRIVHTYRFRPGSYVVDYRLSIGGQEEGVLVTGFSPRLQSNEKNPGDDYNQMRAVARVDGEILTRSAGDVDEGETVSLGGRIDWAGMKNKYFLAMLLAPPDGAPLTAATFRGATGDSLPTLEVAVAAPLTGGEAGYRLYLGPQEYRRLAALNEGLDDVNQYGWSWIRWMITPFAKWIVIIMIWLHAFIPSYGLVLIVFGVMVRLVMWPLTVKSYRSIQAMQELQPEIQRIREQHKEDPQKMQQETMRLYREKKVNPLGGCLPNLLPMPILFALFFVFQSTIELRNQPFLWMADLSQPDPIYILPVFMGLTMYASSKMMTTDPKMSAMTYVMPIVLTFVFLNLAAGLVLYYAFSNLLTFGQQYWMRRGMQRTEASEEEAAGKDEEG